jgi:hypothetical protein
MIYMPLQARPRPTAKAVKEAVEAFDKKGRSGMHSQIGALLHHVLNHCVQKGISFELTYKAGAGYFVKRVKDDG